MNPAAAASTGVAHDKINSLLSQQGETTQTSLFPTGSIYQAPEDKRNIIQKLADEFYESGPIGSVAAAAADILPGIPFVDIIDPPPQLSDPQMQTSRNLLSALGIPLSMSQAPKAVGRVATNIKAPYGYDLKDIRSNVMYGARPDATGGVDPLGILNYGEGYRKYWSEPIKSKRIAGAIGRAIQSISKDEPLHGFAGGATKATNDAREFLYRRAFGLNPRRGTKIFKENKDGTLSFNPKSKRGKELIDEIITAEKKKDFLPTTKIHHSVMGGYTREAGKKSIKYKDVWDFKMNPGEWSRVLSPNEHLSGLSKYYPYAGKRRDIGIAGLRTLVDMMITPPVIKGTVPY